MCVPLPLFFCISLMLSLERTWTITITCLVVVIVAYVGGGWLVQSCGDRDGVVRAAVSGVRVVVALSLSLLMVEMESSGRWWRLSLPSWWEKMIIISVILLGDDACHCPFFIDGRSCLSSKMISLSYFEMIVLTPLRSMKCCSLSVLCLICASVNSFDSFSLETWCFLPL